jgi:hypothetical protein
MFNFFEKLNISNVFCTHLQNEPSLFHFITIEEENTMPSWLKAGLIGGVILLLLDVVIQIPILGCCGWFLTLFAYIGIGAMAAHYTARPRNTGKATKDGAIAAVVAAFFGGVFNFIFGLMRVAVLQAAGQGDILAQIPPELRYQLRDMGISPEFFGGIGGVSVCNSVCCLTGIFIAAILGAIGGAIYASMKYGVADEVQDEVIDGYFGSPD